MVTVQNIVDTNLGRRFRNLTNGASLLEYFVNDFQKTMNFLLLFALYPLLAAERDRDWSQQELEFRSGELRGYHQSCQT